MLIKCECGRVHELKLVQKANWKEKTSDDSTERELDTFEVFWDLYPKTRRKAKKVVFKKWCSIIKDLPDDSVRNILLALRNQAQQKSWLKDNGQFVPLPLTWVNQERWEDETE